MTDHHTDVTLAVTEAMADELTDYLLGDQLYRQLVVKTAAGTRQPKMTLGSLLENLETLGWQAEALSSAEQARLAEIAGQVRTKSRGAFRSQWQDFLRRELKALIGSWRWYLQDAGRSRSAREDYPTEVRQRTRIDLIMRELADDPDIAEARGQVAQLDQKLRGMWQTGGYLGPAGEQSHRSQERAWWLYGRVGEG